MEDYLNRPNIPCFLKPLSSTTVYTNVNLSDPAKYSDKNYKYHQYFANLNNNISFESTFYPNDSFAYYKTHKVFRPVSKTLTKKKSNPSKQDKNGRSFQSFDSFVDVPTLFSDEQMAGVSYQTAVDMVDSVYLFGGLQALLTDEYEQKLRSITKDFTIPPENIKMVCDYDLPLPLDREKIESIALRPYNRIRKYLTESKSFKFVCDLSNEVTEKDVDEYQAEDDSPHLNNNHYDLKLDAFASSSWITKTNIASNSSSYVNAAPRSMICSGACRLSDRFFMIYGGLEIGTKISYPDKNHCVIEKVLTPNDQFWLFDRIKCSFREIKLSVHPTYNTIFPTIPRFAHSVASVPMDDDNIANKNSLDDTHFFNSTHNQEAEARHSQSSAYIKPATMFVMGGYKLHSSGKSFVAMNDLWKLDFFLDANGTADEAVASPIGNFNSTNDVFCYIIDEKLNRLANRKNTTKFTGIFSHSEGSSNWPSPRGFFSMCLIDSTDLSKFIDWRKNDKEDVPVEDSIHDVLHQPSPMRKSALNQNCSEFNRKTSKTSNPSKTDSQIKDMFKRKSETVASASSVKSFNTGSGNEQAHSADSSTRDTNTSPSPYSSRSSYSESNAHTYKNETLRGKSLLVCGGSSILYTKVVDEKNFDVYYNHNMLSDIWIFDFQTERWYNFDDFSKLENRLTMCAHTMLMSGSSLKLLGGIEEGHFPETRFLPIHAGVYDVEDGDTKVQKLNWEKGKNVVQRFHSARRATHDASTFMNDISIPKGMGIDRSNQECYNYYSNYAFQLESLEWRLIKTAIVQDAEFFGPWTANQNAKVICGGMVDDVTTKQKFNLVNMNMLYAHSTAFIKDSKIVIFSPDIKIIDRKTNKYIEGSQGLVGNGVYELYSVYL